MRRVVEVAQEVGLEAAQRRPAALVVRRQARVVAVARERRVHEAARLVQALGHERPQPSDRARSASSRTA